MLCLLAGCGGAEILPVVEPGAREFEVESRVESALSMGSREDWRAMTWDYEARSPGGTPTVEIEAFFLLVSRAAAAKLLGRPDDRIVACEVDGDRVERCLQAADGHPELRLLCAPWIGSDEGQRAVILVAPQSRYLSDFSMEVRKGRRLAHPTYDFVTDGVGLGVRADFVEASPGSLRLGIDLALVDLVGTEERIIGRHWTLGFPSFRIHRLGMAAEVPDGGSLLISGLDAAPFIDPWPATGWTGFLQMRFPEALQGRPGEPNLNDRLMIVVRVGTREGDDPRWLEKSRAVEVRVGDWVIDNYQDESPPQHLIGPPVR